MKYWSSDLVDRLSTSMANIHTAASPPGPPSEDSTPQYSSYQPVACSSNTFVADLTSTHCDVLLDGSLWSQFLLDGAANENLGSRSAEDLQDLQYWRLLRHSGEFIHSERLEDLPPWDVALRNFTSQGDEMQISPLGSISTSNLRYPNPLDDRLLSGTTCPPISEMETWPTAPDYGHVPTESVAILNQLPAGSEPQNEQFDPWHIKLEYPTYGSSPARPPWGRSSSGTDGYKLGDILPSQLLDGPSKGYTTGIRPCFGDDQFPFQKRLSSTQLPRFPTPFAAQTSDENAFLSSPQLLSSTVQQSPMFDGHGASGHALYPHRIPAFRAEATRHGIVVDRTSSSQLHYGFASTAGPGKQLHDNPELRNIGHLDDGREFPSDPKRSIVGSSLHASDSVSEGLFKRPRVDHSNQSLPFKQVRKEKLGDRITTLQQLVSPFGKTDTASVLLEAIGYIKFLQEQVQVLSSPYMRSTRTTTIQKDSEVKNWSNSNKSQQSADLGDQSRKDLRSRGLCLVPVSCTLQLVNDNGADYWTPSLGGSGYG